MSKAILKKVGMTVLSLIAFICVVFGCLTFVGTETAIAENVPVFRMQNGASVCLTKDGIRWKVMMDESVATSIKESDDEFFFILAPTSNIKKVKDGNYAKLLVEGKNYARRIDIDKNTIYTEDNVTWFANGCVFDVLAENRNLEFTVVACIKDAENGTYTYADFNVNDVSRKMVTVLSRSVLNAENGDFEDISKQYSWFGTEDYPIVVDADKISEWLSLKESNNAVAEWSFNVSFDYSEDKKTTTPYSSNGVPLSSYKIVVSDTTTTESMQTPAYYAATVFNSVTGADLQITTTPGEYNIYMGADVSEDLIGSGYMMDEDDYGIYTVGSDIYFVGKTRGVIYSVYRFLEEMGYRFLTSTVTNADAEVFIPSEMSITDKEDISYREIAADSVLYNAKVDFAVSQGVNGSFTRDIININKYGGAHGYMRTFINDNNENYSDGLAHTINHWINTSLMEYNDGEYAEIFMLDENGNRSVDQICFTNEKALSYITEKVLHSIRKNVEAGTSTDMISVSVKDNNSYCHCADCQTAEAQYGSFGIVLNFVNRVADEVKKSYPDVMIDTMVYAHYQEIKGNIRARDNVIIRYVASFGRANSNQGANGTGAYPNGNGDPAQFIEQVAKVADLSAICENLFVWVHAKDATDLFGLNGDIYSVWQIVNALNRYNVKGYYVESEFWSSSAEFGELRSYLWAKLLNDPSMTLNEYKAHMSDFLNGYYGAAATYIQQYIDYLCDRAIFYSNNWGYGGNCFNQNGQYSDAPYGLPLDLLNTLNGFFNNAENAVSGEELARVRRSRLHLRFTELNYLYYNDSAAFSVKAPALYDDLLAAQVKMYNEVELKDKSSIRFASSSFWFITLNATPLKSWWQSGQSTDTVNTIVHFVTNGGDEMSDVKISANTSLVNFDTTYAPSKANAIFEGWYLTPTFDDGSRVGVDLTITPAESSEFTVYAKWDDYTTFAQYYWTTGENIGSYFGGQAAKIILEGYKVGDVVDVTLRVKTSLDGTEGASVRLYQTYADTEWIATNVEDGYWSGVPLDPATESGWRQIKITVELKQDGYVWLAVASETPALGRCFVYIKDVNNPYYTIHFATNGGNAISDVEIPASTSLVGFDAAYAPTKTNAFFDGWYTTSTFDAGTRVGTDITSIPVNGNYELTVYAKWDNYTAFAQYYWTTGVNTGSYFGGQAVQIPLAGCETGDKVDVTMRVKTSLDGTEGASVRLYHSYADTEWLASTATEDGYWGGTPLNPATESGWREITITVELKQDGYVWLAVASEATSLGRCYVYIKDVTFEPHYTVHFVTNGGNAVSDVVILANTSLVNFDATYTTSKSNAFFEGWYTTSTFNAGTRVGTDITSIPVNGDHELTVYAKWDEYTAFSQYYWTTGVNTGSYFGGQAVQIPLAGCETGDKVDVTMRVKTSLDGTEGASVRLYHSYADTEWLAYDVDPDGYWGGVALNPATESGWREITITVELKQDGYVWLAVASEATSLGRCYVYIKDVTFEPHYTVHFVTNGGDAISDVVVSADTSLAGFDATYTTSKSYAFFDGWYTTSTFDAGTRVGTDITSIPVNGDHEFTVYAKWDEYTARAHYYSNQGAWFGGQAAQIPLAGREIGNIVEITMQVKTSLDGTDGASVKLYQAYADTQWIGNVVDGYYSGAALNPATESGWREITITVELKQDGYVWLAVANETPGLGQCLVYIKDVTYEPYYTIHFATNGGNEISDVQIPADTSLVNFDTTYATSKSNAFFDGWYLTSTFDAETRVGTDITSVPLNGDHEFTVYAKWDNYTTFAQFYWLTGVNTGSYFGGQAARIVLDDCEIGNNVEITMKVKTSLDGTAGASVRLYQTYADTEWIGNVSDGYWGGTPLNPATESGWREITITVELKQDGYVWLAVASENPGLGQCFVYIKDVTYENMGDYQFTYSGNWFSSGTATILTGQAANADLVLSMQVRTTADGTDTTNPYIGSFESTTTGSDANFTRGGTLNVSETGWREIIVSVKANDSGDVLLGLGRYAEGSAFTVYVKDVTYVSDYQFTFSGYYFSSGTAKILTGQAANTELEVSMQVRTSADGTDTTNPYIGSFESTTTGSDANFTRGGTLDVSETGWREITVSVKTNANGEVLLGLGRYADGSGFTVYIKAVTIITN